jgi:ABC-type Zn uptake system ZnuABC Zn-binding protein ZnuA
MRRWILFALLAAVSCTGGPSADDGRVRVVTTVAPITDIVRNVAGATARVDGIVPEGTDSHTFEPTPSSVRLIARADVIFLNGLHLEDPTLRLAEANKSKNARIYLLGDNTVSASDYQFDFSFPRANGKPNPHLWMDVALAIRYAELARDELAIADPGNAATYRTNATAYISKLRALDTAVQSAVNTVEPQHRALLTYHDSFAYFAKHYGMRVIGAIQPADFSEPSAREVARLIDQIRTLGLPAIFGSEVFPSKVLAQIARDSGARFEPKLRDDDLPGAVGAPEHSYIGMIVFDVATIVTALGGDASALDAVSPTS